MQKTNRQTTFRRRLARVIAAAFLLVLLAEWGSHSLAFAHSSTNEDPAVHSQHGLHEDLCKTMISCPDGPRQELPPPSPGHDVAQQNIFRGGPQADDLAERFRKDPRTHRSRIAALYRAVAPPFHPPELS